MPPTRHRNFRMPDELWGPFGEAVQAMRTDRSSVLTEFVAWYLHLSNARLPVRPDPQPKGE